MLLKEYFVKQGIKEVEIEEFIRKHFPQGDYAGTEIKRTPLGVKILIYTHKPGRIIGRGGKTINEMTDAIKQRFGLDNPQLDVKVIRNPNLNAKIVAKQIASALERGYNFKKIGNLTIKRIMDAGAVGAEIIISGKMGGGKSMSSKFVEGYLKHCGEPAKTLVDYGFEEALVKLGKIGVKVKIMKEFQEITGEITKKRKGEESAPAKRQDADDEISKIAEEVLPEEEKLEEFEEKDQKKAK